MMPYILHEIDFFIRSTLIMRGQNSIQGWTLHFKRSSWQHFYRHDTLLQTLHSVSSAILFNHKYYVVSEESHLHSKSVGGKIMAYI